MYATQYEEFTMTPFVLVVAIVAIFAIVGVIKLDQYRTVIEEGISEDLSAPGTIPSCIVCKEPFEPHGLTGELTCFSHGNPLGTWFEQQRFSMYMDKMTNTVISQYEADTAIFDAVEEARRDFS